MSIENKLTVSLKFPIDHHIVSVARKPPFDIDKVFISIFVDITVKNLMFCVKNGSLCLTFNQLRMQLENFFSDQRLERFSNFSFFPFDNHWSQQTYRDYNCRYRHYQNHVYSNENQVLESNLPFSILSKMT